MSALDILRGDPELAGLAAFPFDFDLRRAEHGEAVRLASGAPLQPVAGDDTGGTFFVCDGGPVLYASSEGQAALIGMSVDEALEIVIGLPAWRDLVDVTPDLPEAEIIAAVTEAEDEHRAYVPGLDAHRTALLAALGLAERSPVELIARLHAAQLRTEPDHLLLNADELLASEPLHPHAGTPLYDVVLEPGRADLALLRSSADSWAQVAADDVRRATALLAAHYDRDPGDLGFLRVLAEQEARYGMTDELRLSAVLIARYGGTAELPLLHRLRETSFDTHCGLSEIPEEGAQALREWAAAPAGPMFGEDPAQEPELQWIELARRQGRTEHARAALIRLLDDTGPAQTDRLTSLVHELAELGDFAQAARAQQLDARLQSTAWDRGSAWTTLAGLQRQAGDTAAAWDSLRRALRALDPPEAEPEHPGQYALDIPMPAVPADTSAEGWRRYGLGREVVREHFELAAVAGDRTLARAAYERGRELLESLPQEPPPLVKDAVERAARAVG
ncbi:hypothetical protein AB0M28_33530 [Streptomyces sp. NPDC051940]|uniref:hypothetical protein n=1 Tax=Streptomyces sp. NPDC051940 TaxID=3155675 RepID=UPI0034442C93